jgi:hypothetical protein
MTGTCCEWRVSPSILRTPAAASPTFPVKQPFCESGSTGGDANSSSLASTSL